MLTGRDVTPCSSRSANAISPPGRPSPATCSGPAWRRPTKGATGSGRRSTQLSCRSASAAELGGGGLFGALAPVGRLRVGLGRHLAPALGPGYHLVRRLVLRDEAGLHPEVDGLRMVGDDRHRRLLRHYRVAAGERHPDLFEVEQAPDLLVLGLVGAGRVAPGVAAALVELDLELPA